MTDFTVPRVGLGDVARPLLPRRESLSRAPSRRSEVASIRRRRILVRRAVVVAAVLGLLATGITDIRGRVEDGQLDHAQGVINGEIASLRLDLAQTKAHTDIQQNRLRYLDVQTLENRLMVSSTGQEIQSAETGMFYDGVELSALDGCLGGVTQALDQIGVGQNAGGLASLNAVTPLCQSASP